jgi:hypothetical protein
MKHKILYNLALIGLIVSLTSCELCGLKLQENYNFKAAPVQQLLGVNAYEFIKSRRDKDMLFLYMVIEKAGIQNWYNDSVQGRTFIVPNDDVMKKWMTSKGKLSITDFTELEIEAYLMPTICIGEHLTIDMNFNDRKVETLKEGYFIYFRLVEIIGTAQGASDWYRLLINGSDKKTVITSNLRPTNGVIHVIGLEFNRGVYVPQ